MKIGFSLSKCVLDIVQGTVDYDDVLMIVSGTKFNPGNPVELESVWCGYTQGKGFTPTPWRLIIDQERKTKRIVTSLHFDGKLHQPRNFGGETPRFTHHWAEASLPSDVIENSPAMRDAWQTFQVIAGLTQ